MTNDQKKVTLWISVAVLLTIAIIITVVKLTTSKEPDLSEQLAKLIDQSNQDRAILRVYISKQDSVIDLKTKEITALQEEKEAINRTVYTLSKAVSEMNNRYNDLPAPRYDVVTNTVDSTLYYKAIVTRSAKDLAQADVAAKQLQVMTDLYQLASAKNVKYEKQLRQDSLTITKASEVNVDYVKTKLELKREKRKAVLNRVLNITGQVVSTVVAVKVVNVLSK